MAITHIAQFGTNNSKSAGTTLAVSATPGTQPAVGDLIVVVCARDDIANEPNPPTGDSFSDGHGNTYTRIALNGGVSTGTNSTAADSVTTVVFYSVLTVAWSGATTATWTHPSVTARGMAVEHFAPAAGAGIALLETQTSANAAGQFSNIATGQPLTEGDLCFAVAGMESDASVNVPTGDSDTFSGSWSSLVSAGTTGGVANTNVYVASQYKTTTAPGTQLYSVTQGASIDCGLLLVSFHETSTGPYLVGVGAQVASSTGNVTPALPAGTATNDLLLMVIAGRPSSNAADGVTIAGGTDGWAQHGSTSYVAVAAVDDLSVQVWWKLHDGSESNPTVAVNTVLAQAAATDRGYSAQIAAFRNVHTSVPFDVSAVTSNTGAAAATFTPTGVTTAHNGALALSVVATSDDNALNFNTSQSFVAAFGGVDYDTITGTDHAVGLACKAISAAGAVTEPTWNQSVNGNDQWVGLSTALRASSSGTAYDLGANTALTTTLAGSLAVAHPLAGSTRVTTTLSGGFKKVHNLGGGTKIPHQGVGGGLHKTVGLAGSTRVTFASAGSFIASHTLAGTTGLTMTLSGAFKRTVFFAGATSLTTALNATRLQSARRLVGTTSLTTSAAGALSRSLEMAGTTGLTTTLAAGLQLVAHLNGQTGLVTAFTGDLLAIRLLAGATSVTVGADGQLIVGHPLAGTVTLTTTLLGELTEILGPNAYLLGAVLASVVDATIRANVVESPLTAAVLTDRIEASVR